MRSWWGAQRHDLHSREKNKMMNDEIYTKENCKLVGEWLGFICYTHHDELFPVDECTLCHDTTQLGARLELSKGTPELIREALCRGDKILVIQNHHIDGRYEDYYSICLER